MKKIICSPIVIATLIAGSALGTTRNVGSGQTYSSITAAINASVDNDTIVVHGRGPYPESVSLNKNGLTLMNNPGDTPLIQRIRHNFRQ